MPCLPNNPDRVSPVGRSDDDLDAAIAKLWASPPLGVDDFFADRSVGVRIGTLITQATNKRGRKPS
jgi:hypothetical protein